MNTKQFHRRMWAMVMLLALMITGMGAALYDLQINNGDYYYALTQRKIAETQTVEAARGQILDRNGQVLVSNKVIYKVTLDLSQMGEEQNGVLLSLIEAARAEGVEWTDSLPITQTEPFRFTTDEPYFSSSRDEEGAWVKTLTRLGRLAVKLGWVDDPTKAPEVEAAPEPKEEKPGLLDRLKSLIKGEQKEAPKKAKEPKPLLSAEALLGAMCRSFGVKGGSKGGRDRPGPEHRRPVPDGRPGAGRHSLRAEPALP